jgi:hypothetical protein
MNWGVPKAVLLGVVTGIAVAATAVGSARWADAKSTYDSPYGYERTWNAALRLVRVDNGWKVSEKDEASGYLMFEYASPESGKPSAGSLELVRGQGRDTGVSVLVQLPQMPHYHEQVLLDALAAKMRREYGDPPAPRQDPTPPPAPPADGGTSSGDRDD